MSRRDELMCGRPRDMHPKTWLMVLAKREVSNKRGVNLQDEAQRRRVSAAYQRLLAEYGCNVVTCAVELISPDLARVTLSNGDELHAVRGVAAEGGSLWLEDKRGCAVIADVQRAIEAAERRAA